jgi:LMBR1 domain-containing protein 1
MVFGGIGMVALPIDMVLAFFSRPRATITKSEYLKRAKALGERAVALKVLP